MNCTCKLSSGNRVVGLPCHLTKPRLLSGLSEAALSDILSTAKCRQFVASSRLSLQAAIAAAILLLSSGLLTAQSSRHPSAAQPSSAAKVSTRHKAKPVKLATLDEQPVTNEPEVPHWPVNETPTKPSITWDAQGLKIDATNSSLRQILDDVSNATGARSKALAPMSESSANMGQDRRTTSSRNSCTDRNITS